MKKAILCILLLGISQCVSGQNGIYPLSLLRIKDNNLIDNPSAGTQATSIQLISSNFIGLPGNVGLNFLNFNYSIENKEKRGSHLPGLTIHSEFETNILRRTRVYGRYVYSTYITNTIKVSAGINIGFLNYFIRSTNSSAGISAFVPDASSGLWVQGRKFNIGVAASQLLNTTIRPFNAIYNLHRYYSATGDIKIIDLKDFELAMVVRGFYNTRKHEGISGGLNTVLMKNFSAEFNYVFNRGISVSAGFIQFPILFLTGDFYVSYYQSVNNVNVLNINRFELNLKIYPRNKSNIASP